MRRSRLRSILVCLAITCGAYARADDKVVRFDGLAFGSLVTNQYAPLGVMFGEGPPGLSACNAVGIGGTAPYVSSLPNAAYASGHGEFPIGRICMRFSTPASHVSVQAGTSGVGSFFQVVSLIGYDISGHPLTGGGTATKSMSANGLAGRAHHLAISTPAPLIHWVVVQFGPPGDSAIFGAGFMPTIDDLSFDSSISVPTSFTVSATHGFRIIRQGSTASILLSILRFGNPPSIGDINLSVSGLPSGVTATFSSNPVGGSATSQQVSLTLHASADAPSTDMAKPVAVTITATPASPSVGSTAATVGAAVVVQPALELRVGSAVATSADSVPTASVSVFPCEAPSITIPLWLRVPFSDSPPPSGPVTLSISKPVQMTWLTTALNRAVVEPGLYPMPATYATLTLDTGAYSTSDGSPTNILQVHASQAPGIYRTLSLNFKRSDGVIDYLRPTPTVRPPERLEPGTQLDIYGHGLCPGSTVQFGNVLATATPTSFFQGNFESISVQTPRLATSGDLVVLNAAGGIATLASNAPAVTPMPPKIFVNDERGYSGFSFKNKGVDTIDWDVFVALFGEDQTMLNPCSPVTLGLIDCDTPIPDPFAWNYWMMIKGQGDGGVCFGWTMSTQRLYRSEASPGDFPPNNLSAHQWELNSPDAVGGPSSELSSYIQAQHLSQFSAEYLAYFIANDGGFDTLSQLSAVYRDKLQNHYPDLPLIDMRNALFKGHTVAVYDAVDTPGGGLDLYVINPNAPFTTAPCDNSKGPCDEKAVDGQAHFNAVIKNSRIVFDADGNWTFPNLGWSGDITQVKYLDAGAIPVQPTLPLGVSGALVFASGAAIEQVSDTSGHRLFRPDGTVETSPPDRLPGATIIPSESSPIIFLRNTDPVTLLAKPHQTSNWQVGFVGGGMLGRVQIGGPSSDTTIIVDPQGGIGARAAVGANVQLQLAFRGQEESQTSISFTGHSTGGSDRLALGINKSIQLIHEGPKTTGSIVLEWIDRKRAKRTLSNFQSNPLSLRENSTLEVVPLAWSNLASGVTITTHSASGAVRVRHVRDSRPPVRGVTIRTINALSSSDGVALLVDTDRKGLPDATHATIIWVVRLAGEIVARHSDRLPQSRAGVLGAERTWLFKPTKPGRYQFEAAIVTRFPDGRASIDKRARNFYFR